MDQQHVDNDGNDNLTASYGNDYYPAEWATALQGTRLRHFCPRYRGIRTESLILHLPSTSSNLLAFRAYEIIAICFLKLRKPAFRDFFRLVFPECA
jgi:hypothetical protein